jgi:hypothetical protein
MSAFVEVIQPFDVGATTVPPGARLAARQEDGVWYVFFNGAELRMPRGVVGAVDSPEVKAAAEERKSAREEEYQLAVTPPKAG